MRAWKMFAGHIKVPGGPHVACGPNIAQVCSSSLGLISFHQVKYFWASDEDHKGLMETYTLYKEKHPRICTPMEKQTKDQEAMLNLIQKICIFSRICWVKFLLLKYFEVDYHTILCLKRTHFTKQFLAQM